MSDWIDYIYIYIYLAKLQATLLFDIYYINVSSFLSSDKYKTDNESKSNHRFVAPKRKSRITGQFGEQEGLLVSAGRIELILNI